MENGHIQYSKFAVDEAPFCVWEWDLHERNLAFINSIDPAYFAYLANTHGQCLETDAQKQHAALSLRTAYSHGLETLFALLFSAIQAPDCVIGWLHKYDVGDLRSLIKKVQTWQPILSNLEIKPITWETISDTIHIALSLEDKEKEKRVKSHFATAWRRFGSDLSDDKSGLEYNSIKHGFRARAGGFRVAIGIEDTPGVPAPPERMRSLGGSEFGSSFFIPEKISDNKLHFRVRRHSRNWNPENFIYRLHLISLSLQNILSFLKVINGVDAATVKFSCPSDETHFEEPWRSMAGVTSMGMDTIIMAGHIMPFSKDEILAVYKVDSNNEVEDQST
ncbi:hypothetical protein HY605_02435 [Candidatus Peregrinibacteria bacterium]|nr:hypothetical protein [Candidatus Peregrinibacteria bacterium]